MKERKKLNNSRLLDDCLRRSFRHHRTSTKEGKNMWKVLLSFFHTDAGAMIDNNG
jgi:hypothetical protein